MAASLQAQIEEELAGTPELAEFKRRSQPFDPDDYPKPEQQDIMSELERLRTDLAHFHTSIRDARDVRFLRDVMPDKWAKELEIGPNQHIHSRLGHNMILRIVAMATRNPPKFRIDPGGKSEKDQDRARKQTRWCDNLWPNFERAQAKRRAVIDSQCADGLGILEIYRTGSYDKLDVEAQPDEPSREYMRRTEQQYIGASSPYGVRQVDVLAAFWDWDGLEGDPVPVCIFEEDVAEAPMSKVLRSRLSPEKFQEWQAHRIKGATAQPHFNNTGKERPSRYVKKVTYYDRRWYACIVDGVIVDGPTEHGMGFVPVVFYEGMTTGSTNRSERYQGVFWGMEDLEKAINWLTTLDLDNAFTLSKPKIAITQPMNSGEAQRAVTRAPEKVEPISFRNGQVPRLRPGEVPVNLTETFKGFDTSPIRAWIMQLIQISGLNPVAQGESPGSDPAGYAVNALQSAAQANYEVLLDNAARGDADLANKMRKCVRNLGQPWYLTAPMGGRKKSGTAWLGLNPDDVDDTPARATIDPLSDVNRIAVQETKRQANKEGFISRWRVQESYGVEDYDMEDEDILEDTMEAELGRLAIEEAKMAIMEAQGQPMGAPSGLVDQNGQPLPPSGAPTSNTAGGATPAPLNPPTVGPMGAKPGPASQPGTEAGFDRGARPPNAGSV